MSADKPEPMPWETEPYVDRHAAEEKAIAAAQRPRVATNSTVVVSYARKAFDDETERVASAPTGERNNVLFKAAANLFELVAAGALPEADVVSSLRNAATANGSIRDDGETQFDRTIAQARRRGFDNPRDLSVVGRHAGKVPTVLIGGEERPQLTLDDIPTLERGFWSERESLQTIYLAALSGMSSPWAVLGHCAARALALVRPTCLLPAIIGHGGGSLNWFCAIAAKSGGGKDSAASIAEHLVRGEIYTRNLGTGEGLIDAYVTPANKETGEPKGLRESVLFMADEVDTLHALTNRGGSTLSGTLRSAFSGSTIGFSYRTSSDQHLMKHSYRLTLVVGVQPAKAGAITDDIYGGTLQRFMWFPGNDSRITAEVPREQAPLDLPSLSAWNYPMELKIPYDAVELIRDERVRQQSPEYDGVDTHGLFVREKFAYALAVLDGRHECITDEDWRLAGIASRISNFTRDWVRLELLQAQEQKMAEEGRLLGVRSNAADEERAYQTNERLARIAKWALGKLGAADAGLTPRELTRAVASRDRPHLPSALARLQDNGVVTLNNGRWSLVKPS